jgi:hypothetical protein
MVVQMALNAELDITVAFGPFIVFFSGLLGAFSRGVSSNVLNERNLTHGMRNEIVARKQRIKSAFARPVVRTKGREEQKGKREKKHRSGVAKSMVHQRRECETEQTDPLARRIQVEDEVHQERAVSSSGSQTEALGKHG